MKAVVAEINEAEEGEIAEVRRDGSAQTECWELEGDDSFGGIAAAGDSVPSAEAGGVIPRPQATKRVASYSFLELKKS